MAASWQQPLGRARSSLGLLVLLQTHWAYVEANGAADGAARSSSCLPDAVPEESRLNVPGLNGTGSVPFGIFVLDWDSGILAAHVVKLLAEEVLGYHSVFTGMGIESPSAIYATAGCGDPNAFYLDPLCSDNPTFVHHASLEAWDWDSDSLSADSRFSPWPSIRPVDIGDMGYVGVDGFYVLREEKEKAYQAEGLPLEFYRSYNATWHTPQVYFDNYTVYDLAELKLCNETRFVESSSMQHYIAVTGDLDGVVNSSGALSARCWSGSWWFAPACRGRPERCVPVLTGGSGWSLFDIMQRAAVFEMPLAVAVATTWSTRPRTTRCLPYWWQPDSTFIDLHPTIITFPPYNEAERSQNIRTSMTKDVRLSKWVHNRLVEKAPALTDFMQAVRMTSNAMTQMLAENKRRGGSAYSEVACDWIRTQRPTWKNWIPAASKCASGFGLTDHRGIFQTVRTDESTCSQCPTGKYSDPYRDNVGATHLCTDCAAGRSSESGGSSECAACRPGFFAKRTGSSACKACPSGTFSEDTESGSCSSCSGDFVTYPGASSSQHCVCPEGFYRPLNITDGAEHAEDSCVQCPEGMGCEMGSDMRNVGLPRTDVTQYPYLKPGYWSSFEDPLSVFECHSAKQCLGGVPGASCAAKLGSRACVYCESQTYWDGSACIGCISSPLLFPLLPSLLVPPLALAMYKSSQVSLKSWDSGKNALFVIGYIILSFYQTLNLLRNSIQDVPRHIDDYMSYLVISTDVASVFQSNCIGYDTFQAKSILSALLPIGVVILTFVTMSISWILAAALRREHWRMRFDGVHHIIGSFIFTFFNGLVAQSLNLFNCISNPNGLYTMASDRSIICYDSDTWKDMLTLAIASTLLYCGGASLAVIFAVVMAKRNGNYKSLGFQTRWKFLFCKFRADAYWFGVVCLARGTLLNIGLVVLDNDLAKLYWAFSVVMIYNACVVQLMPFRWIICNKLDLLCSLSITYHCLAFVMFTRDRDSMVTAVSHIVIAFMFVPFAILISGAYQVLKSNLFPGATTDVDYHNLFSDIKESCSAIVRMPEEVGTEMLQHMGEWDKDSLRKFSTLINQEVLGDDVGRLTSGHISVRYHLTKIPSDRFKSMTLRAGRVSGGNPQATSVFSRDGAPQLTSEDGSREDCDGEAEKDNAETLLTSVDVRSKWAGRVAVVEL
mmetsp:Transcript_61763/g.180480  ORF Transcript_61763/g.180480 Transcript_61763/m.180480 type:complete len:1173 (-) Transcript_61763:184-3702(-)